MEELTINIKNNMKRKFHKDTFENISEERREKIFNVAISEFAANGYNGANINAIAQKSNISIGSLYSYFASKEDLFLSIVDNAYALLTDAIKDVETDNGLFVFIENLLRIAKRYATDYPEINQIYIDLTTQSVAKFSNALSHKLEEITSKFYIKAIKSAKEKNEIKSELNEGVLAFLIDNIVSMYQFSFSSDYYKERMKIYLGKNKIDDDSVIIELVNVIRNGIEMNS